MGSASGGGLLALAKTPAPQTVVTPEVNIQYLEYGSPNGTPVILLHGFPDAPVAWEPVITHLDAAKYRLIVPYLRGFGETQVTSLDLVGGQEAALGSDLLAFADALGIPSFHLAGHDWGARTAYAACVFAPKRVRSLLALASPYTMYAGRDLPPEQVRAYWYQWFFQLELGRKMMIDHPEEFCHQLWQAWSPEWKFSADDFAAAATAWKNPQFAATVLHYYRMRWGGALSLRGYAEVQAQLDSKPKPKIATPTIYVCGGADACVLPAASEEQADSFSSSYERIVLKGVGHFPHREEPKTIGTLLSRQLKAAE